MKDDTISRQAAIDALEIDAEFLNRVLDDPDVVGSERRKYEWGLGLIESYISDICELPSAQPEIIHCKDCKYGVDYYHDGECYCLNPKWGLMYSGGSWEFYCADAKRRADE
jgi:hypothetical protein